MKALVFALCSAALFAQSSHAALNCFDITSVKKSDALYTITDKTVVGEAVTLHTIVLDASSENQAALDHVIELASAVKTPADQAAAPVVCLTGRYADGVLNLTKNWANRLEQMTAEVLNQGGEIAGHKYSVSVDASTTAKHAFNVQSVALYAKVP